MYDSKRDRLVFSFMYVSRTGALQSTQTMRLIYSFRTKSWFEHTDLTYSNRYAVFYVDDVYFTAPTGDGTSKIVVRRAEGHTSYGTMPIAFRSAPLPISKFGVNLLSGIEMIVEGDQALAVEYRIRTNLGAAQTETQKVTQNGVYVCTPIINAGSLGSYAQLQMENSATGTVESGQKYYGFNLWYQPGGLR